MVTVSRTLIRRLIRMGSYLFLATIVALTSFIGLGRKDKHTLDYSFTNNVAHADSPHDSGDTTSSDGGTYVDRTIGDDMGGGGGDDSPDGCFAPGTQITMEDGTTKAIETVVLGDRTKGGVVTGVMQFRVPSGDMYTYKGVTVSGSHTLNDSGVWRYVKESPLAVPTSDTEGRIVYIINATNHRVYVNGVEFSDYIEVDGDTPVRTQYLKDLLWHNQVQIWRREGVSMAKMLVHLREYLK